jgi:hypothetical protein
MQNCSTRLAVWWFDNSKSLPFTCEERWRSSKAAPDSECSGQHAPKYISGSPMWAELAGERTDLLEDVGHELLPLLGGRVLVPELLPELH